MTEALFAILGTVIGFALSELATELAAEQPREGSEPSGGLAAIEAQVDEAAELWSITDRELKETRRSLAELE